MQATRNAGFGARTRVGVVALGLAAAVLLGPAASVAAASSQGPIHQKVPNEVIAQVAALQRIFGSFSINPTSGGIGTVITYSGYCGFPAENVSVSLAIEVEPGSYHAAAINLLVPIPESPYGSFSVQLVVPEVNVDGNPMSPGPYAAFAACDFLSPTERDLGPQPFTLLAS